MGRTTCAVRQLLKRCATGGAGRASQGGAQWALTGPVALRAGGGGVDVTGEGPLGSSTRGEALARLGYCRVAAAVPSSGHRRLAFQHRTCRLCWVAVVTTCTGR